MNNMKTKITSLIVILGVIALLVFPTVSRAFFQTSTEEIYRSGLNSEDNKYGVQNIKECSRVRNFLQLWNDPDPETLTGVRSEVILPTTFSNSGNYDSTATNFAVKGSTNITESDTDNIKWETSANGKQYKLIPGFAGYYMGQSFYDLSDPVITNIGNNQQKLSFNTLPNLPSNSSIQIEFYMKVGDNCIESKKELLSNANTVYKAGDKVDYLISLKNTGSYEYVDVSFSDTFDTNAYSTNISDISFVKQSGDLTVLNTAYTNGKFVSNLGGSLLGGATSTFKLTLTVKTGFTSQTACNLTANYAGSDFYHIFNPSGSVSMIGNLCVNLTQPTPGLGINKEIVGSDLSQVNYKITLTNTGTVTLSSLAVTDLYDSTKYVFLSSTPVSNSAGNGVVSITNLGNLAPGAKKEVFISFRFANNLVDGQACNKEVNAYATYYNNERTLELTSKFEPDICVETPRSAIEVVKRLSTSSSKQIIYTVDIKNKGSLDLNNINVLDIFDNTRLSVKSVEVANEVVNGDRFTVTNLLNVALKANEKVTFVITFDVLAKAPAGLACNKEISVSAKDTLNRTVNSNQVLEQNTVNCVNLIIIENKKPNFSVSKRLVSKTDSVVNDVVQWEIVTTNICIGNDCEVADRVAFRDYFSSTNLKFNSAFAQLKNADGSNVNASPIAFSPVVTSENGNTVLTYDDLTEVVGNVSAGQYIVVEIYTTALKTNSSCVNNTVTISGPNNSVSASACVNIVTKYTPSDNKDRLPNTDILDSLSVLMGAPTSLKIAFLILALAIGFGTTVPTVLLVKAKKNN